MSEDESVDDRMNKLEAALEQLKAEIAWLKLVLAGKAPEEHPDNTSPPWVLILVGAITPLAVAIVSTQPWK